MDRFDQVVETIGTAVDAAGVAVIVVGILAATVGFFRRVRGNDFRPVFNFYRRGLVRTSLLALEFFIAGDLVRTVAIGATFQQVGFLAAIVAIRILLSVTLEAEIEGRWPWQGGSGKEGGKS